jgi:hypothetical protein
VCEPRLPPICDQPVIALPAIAPHIEPGAPHKELPDDLIDAVLLRAFLDDPCGLLGDAALDGRMLRVCLNPASRSMDPGRADLARRLSTALLVRGRPAALLRLLRRAAASGVALDPPCEAWRLACALLRASPNVAGGCGGGQLSGDRLAAVQALYGFHGARCHGGRLMLQLLPEEPYENTPASALDSLDTLAAHLLASWLRASTEAASFFERPPGLELVRRLLEARCPEGLAALAAAGVRLLEQRMWRDMALSRRVVADAGCVRLMARLGYRTTREDVSSPAHSSPTLLLAHLRCWASTGGAGTGASTGTAEPMGPAGQGLHHPGARDIEQRLRHLVQ